MSDLDPGRRAETLCCTLEAANADGQVFSLDSVRDELIGGYLRRWPGRAACGCSSPVGTVAGVNIGEVLLVGDTHGNTQWLRDVVDVAVTRAATIVVLGDFGYWVHKADGRQFIDEVDAAVCAAGLPPLVFIDGNHEYHSTHPAKPPHRRHGLQELEAGPDGFVHISEHIRYAPRGHRWTWGGVRFGALGGAASTDREYRKQYKDYWLDETVSLRDVERLGADPLDILLCHDAPAGHDIPNPFKAERVDDRRSTKNRDLLGAAVAATNPKLVVHGHWHVRYSHMRATGAHAWRVVGLGADVSADGDGPGKLGDALAWLSLSTLDISEVEAV